MGLERWSGTLILVEKLGIRKVRQRHHVTRRLVTWPLRTRYRFVRLPVQTVRWCLRKSNTASVAKHRDLPSPVGKETKTSLHSRNSRTALSWSLVAAAYPRVRKACLMASFTSSTATPLTSSLGISRIDARRTPLVITRSDASFSGNLIGQNDIVLQWPSFSTKCARPPFEPH